MKIEEFSRRQFDLLREYTGHEHPCHVLIFQGPSGKFDIMANESVPHILAMLRSAIEALEGQSMTVVHARTPEV